MHLEDGSRLFLQVGEEAWHIPNIMLYIYKKQFQIDIIAQVLGQIIALFRKFTIFELPKTIIGAKLISE